MMQRSKQRIFNKGIPDSWDTLEEMFTIFSHLENCKSKLLWESLLYLSESLSSKIKWTAHAGEDVKQVLYCSIVKESATLYSHYGNQYGGSPENWESIYLKT